MSDLESYRSQFYSLRNCHHLISNSLGAMPNDARLMAARYADAWAEQSVRAWKEDWWVLAHRVGDKIGALMNAERDTVSMHPNVTSASAVVLSCFDWDGPRNKVVMVDMEFPSIQYLYHEWLRGRGEIVTIPCPDGITIPTEELLDAIDERTCLVPISHVLFRSSYIVDVAAIIRKAHSVGAMVVLDVFQSLGTVPVDVVGLDVDFAVGGCLKWLCGGPGACFLYVHPDRQNKLEPRFTGWLAHANPFAFEAGPTERARGSYRFMSGTPNIPAFYTCQPGLDIVSEIGVRHIRSRSLEMTTRLLELAEERNWPTTTPTDPNKRGGTVAINIPKGEALSAALNIRGFLVDYRPKAGIRISPHFYNTDEEIDNVVHEIDRLISKSS